MLLGSSGLLLSSLTISEHVLESQSLGILEFILIKTSVRHIAKEVMDDDSVL